MTKKEKAFIESQIKHYRRLSYECLDSAWSADTDEATNSGILQARLFDERVECLGLLLENLEFGCYKPRVS